MKYRYWKCKICKEEFRTSTSMAEFDLKEHLKKHLKELKEFENAENQYDKGEQKLRKKYEKMYLGYWIEDITPPVKRKLWKCPKCGEEMTYYHKYWHQNNCKR